MSSDSGFDEKIILQYLHVNDPMVPDLWTALNSLVVMCQLISIVNSRDLLFDYKKFDRQKRVKYCKIPIISSCIALLLG